MSETTAAQPEATWEFESSRAPFAELGLRQNPGLLKLYEIASQSRQEQQNMIDAARTLIAQSRANDTDGANKTVDTFNAHSSTYNDNVRKMNELRQQLFPTHERFFAKPERARREALCQGGKFKSAWTSVVRQAMVRTIRAKAIKEECLYRHSLCCTKGWPPDDELTAGRSTRTRQVGEQ